MRYASVTLKLHKNIIFIGSGPESIETTYIYKCVLGSNLDSFTLTFLSYFLISLL